MAAAKKKTKTVAAPKQKKNLKKANEYYEVSGSNVVKKNKHCPKCGPGIFMGKHKDRLVCGKCQYVEFVKE